MDEITMTSSNHGSQGLGEDNSNLSQDPPQAITITIMEPSSTLGETLHTSSISATNLNNHLSSIVSNGSGAGTVLVVPRRGGAGEVATSCVISEKEHVLQTSISKTQLEEELPVISNISNPEEVVNEGQEVTKDGEAYDGEDIDIAASCEPHCLICNKELPQKTEDDTPVALFQVQTTTTQRKMSVLLGVLVGQKITSRKSHSDLVCSRCYNLLDKVDSLEVELQDTKDDLVNKYQTTLAVYGGRARRRKPATAKNSDFVFPKLEPDELEKEEVSLELDSNFEPRAEDLLEEEADQQEDLIASGALDDEWEPEFKRPRLKRENTDADPGVAPKRRRGRPRKDATKAKGSKQDCQGCHKDIHIEKINSETTTECFGTTRVLNKHKTNPDRKKKDCKQTYSYLSKAFLNMKTSGNVCPVCNKNFVSEIETKEHFDFSHTELDEYVCPICKTEISANFQEILCHLRQSCKLEQFENSEKISELKLIFQENQKDQSLQKRCTIISEMEEKHNLISKQISIDPKMQIPCPECDTFVMPTSLKRHINDCHTKKVSYPCPECSAVYHDASNLLSHRKRNHFSGEARRHLCEVCGKKFVAPSDLKIHVMGVHQNIKKFICEFCGLSFKIASALTYHRRLHTGERPHVCNICGRTFTKPNAMSKHMKNVHRVEYQGKYRKRLQQPEFQLKSLTTPQASSITKETLVDPINTGVESIPESGLSITGNGVNRMGVTTIYALGGQMQFASPTMMGVSQPLHALSYYPDRNTLDETSDPIHDSASTHTADIIHIHIEPGIPQSDSEVNLTSISQHNTEQYHLMSELLPAGQTTHSVQSSSATSTELHLPNSQSSLSTAHHLVEDQDILRNDT